MARTRASSPQKPVTMPSMGRCPRTQSAPSKRQTAASSPARQTFCALVPHTACSLASVPTGQGRQRFPLNATTVPASPTAQTDCGPESPDIP